MGSHWVTIAGMAMISYAIRVAPLVLGGGQVPPWLARGMAYVPVALFAALAAPAFMRPHGVVTVGPEAVAGVAAALVAWRTGGKTIPVLAAGIAVYAALNLIWRQ